ncbi:Sarcosine oxidase subunit beta [Dirofilaria immitis]
MFSSYFGIVYSHVFCITRGHVIKILVLSRYTLLHLWGGVSNITNPERLKQNRLAINGQFTNYSLRNC